MKETDIYSELASIRTLMERSTKFISLSGLSGVLAGIYALIGSFLGYRLFYGQTMDQQAYNQIALLGAVILILSIFTGVLLTMRQAKKNGDQFWNPVSRRLFTSMVVPLLSGGIFIMILFFKAEYDNIAAACLLFYGLALVAAGQYTFTDVKWLGFCDILLGLLAAWMPECGLIFWATGFGLLHVVYGTVMHFKYNR